MTRKRILAFLVIGVLAVALVIAVIVRNFDYSTVIAMNWSLRLPGNYQITYSADSEPNVFGDGPRYHIFSYRHGIEDSFLDDFSQDKDLDFEAEVEIVLGYLDIQDNLIDFDEPYLWKKVTSAPGDDNLYLIYQGSNDYLYIVELFL